jgi:hypothetical protein
MTFSHINAAKFTTWSNVFLVVKCDLMFTLANVFAVSNPNTIYIRVKSTDKGIHISLVRYGMDYDFKVSLV